MGEYLFKTYWRGALIITVLYVMFSSMDDLGYDPLTYTTCFVVFFWIIKFVVTGSSDNQRKLMVMAGDLIKLLKLIWYVVTLKPLRRWLFRLYYVGARPEYYPFLALYGSLLDTHVMKYKFSAAFTRIKAPAARAALWRLLARGALELGADNHGHAVIKTAKWTASHGDVVDEDFERSVFKFLQQSLNDDGAISAKKLKNVMVNDDDNVKTPRTLTRTNLQQKASEHYDNDDQYHYADLLNTGLSLKSYTQRDVQHLFGMKRFLAHLPQSLHQSYTTQPPQLTKVWPEYMAYAYLFGIEKKVFRQLTQLLSASDAPLLHRLAKSTPHRDALRQLMRAVNAATPAVEDSVAAKIGLMPLAWHVNEIYDI